MRSGALFFFFEMGLSVALGPVLDRHPILRDSAIFLKKTTKAVEGNEAVYIPYILLYLFFFFLWF